MGTSKFNQTLNASQNPDVQYGRWTSYRTKLTDFIVTQLKPEDRVMVVGAGNGNDIDLERLQNAVSELVLTDIDISAMRQGCLRQGASVPIHGLDYLGIDRKGLMDHLRNLLPNYTKNSLKHYLDDVIRTVHESEKQWLERAYDVLIVLPIHTQLFFREAVSILQFGHYSDLILETQYAEAERLVLDAMPELLQTFNRTLLRQLEARGRMIAFSDYLEDVPGGDYSSQFDAATFDEVYHKYEQAYGMGLGHFGLFDMSRLLDTEKECWFRWPFDEQRELYVKGVHFHKKH